ncbi:glutathione peroxidase [Ureibacillus thermophilus]|uniref:glutathione peroxidase n=1 Tax=Ureibacillus thermophilus TaxID=367743 RepID=UPI00361A313C
MNIYDIDVTTATGETYSLSRYKGQVMLIVNTASHCGFTPQFEELEKLYQKYKDRGFVVLGFPSNQFKQELPSAKEAEAACRLHYGVTFPIHEMVAVNGEEAHPLFQFLTSQKKGVLSSKVKWNFTKFLVNRNGEVVARFAPIDKPSKFEKEIEKYL